MKLIAACAFGIEAIVKRELVALGYEPTIEQPGRISFEGDEVAICQANLWLRCADRILIEVQKFDCPDFDALFETIKAHDWSQWIPAEAEFPVIGKSRLSQLSSVPAIQRATKKALVESLRKFHGVQELPETGSMYKVEVALLNDVATLTIDTTGPSLHKRGYRKLVGAAPLKETLAAALVDLSVWRASRPLVDPFCGSGTIPIEAAMKARNMAPGLHRQFASSDWQLISQKQWQDQREGAAVQACDDVELSIIATDRDEEVLSLARYHARQANVAQDIHFQQRSFDELRSKREYGVIITNPPYGERLEEQKRLIGLYESFPMVMQRLPTWSLYLITNMPKFEALVQRKATRRRKLFNGRIECTYYQFLGPRPPRPVVDVDASAGVATSAPDRSTAISQQPATEPSCDAVAGDVVKAPKESTVEFPAAKPPEKTPPKGDDQSAPKVVAKPSFDSPNRVQRPIGSKEVSKEVSKEQRVEVTFASNNSSSSNSDGRPRPVEVEVVGQRRDDQLFGGLTAKDQEQAELFRNRLVKRARHLRRWPKRGITCFRLYERDIPEIPLVVDRYENHLHITEYERPHDRDLARHAAWLELMAKTAGNCLDVPIQRVHLKQRRKGDTGQYHKLDEKKKRIEVSEQGLKFLVNLEDYVDTGLFLDHRVARSMVRERAEGKRFLNLFAYTGAFTVYAAAGGAKSSVTVDLSRNYLDWAEDNLRINDLSGSQHQMVADDTIDFLDAIASQGPQFDLAVVDPPTFSNSKRLDRDWDVQTGYDEVLRKLWTVMVSGGEVYFSTNFRRFKFDEGAIGNFEVREISNQTVPDDFRNRRIHRCWYLQKK